jgi:hypothetical protein
MTTTTAPNAALANMSQAWWNLDLSDKEVVDRAYARTQRLMREDETVQMLSEKSILVLLSALYFGETGLVANLNRINVYGADQVLPRVRHAIQSSPLTIVNDAFIEHVAAVVIHAIFPESIPGRSED